MRHYVIATAGHVDHGKSSLVKALTGTDPDRLPEEKARQITIDLGFANLELAPDVHAAIIDVPGHEDFVGNMIAGVGSIDLALLVVAADDGWMPQTEEHFQILQYLGLNRAVVALTKADMADATAAEQQVRDRLRDTPFAAASIVQTAFQNMTALSGHVSGLRDLKQCVAAELASTLPQRDIDKPRLFVDRAFTLRGVGTVVTGSLTGGSLRVGDNIVVQPSARPARIRALQSHNTNLDVVGPGRRVALNLPELHAGVDVRRGNVVTTGEFEPVSRFVVALGRSSHAQGSPALKSGMCVLLHHGASRAPAQVFLREKARLLPGESDTADIRAAMPLLVFVGDRFVIRDQSQQHTIAGGVVVGRAESRGRVPTRADIDACIGYELDLSPVVERSSVLRHSRFSTAEVGHALVRRKEQGSIVFAANFAMASQTWQKLRTAAVDVICTEHSTNPDRPGIQLSDLRSSLAGYPSEAVDAIVADLLATEFVRSGSFIGARSHQRSLAQPMQAEAAALLKQLSSDPRNPPTQRAARAVVNFLVAEGSIVELAPDVLLRADIFTEMKSQVTTHLKNTGRASASELRQALGTSRRVIIPFLELLDRQHLTRRVGDQRVLAGLDSNAKLQNAPQARR